MLSAAIETYRSKTVFLYRVSDPLSSTVEIVERERERTVRSEQIIGKGKAWYLKYE